MFSGAVCSAIPHCGLGISKLVWLPPFQCITHCNLSAEASSLTITSWTTVRMIVLRSSIGQCGLSHTSENRFPRRRIVARSSSVKARWCCDQAIARIDRVVLFKGALRFILELLEFVLEGLALFVLTLIETLKRLQAGLQPQRGDHTE